MEKKIKLKTKFQKCGYEKAIILRTRSFMGKIEHEVKLSSGNVIIMSDKYLKESIFITKTLN